MGLLGYLNGGAAQAAFVRQAGQALFGAASQTAAGVDEFIRSTLDTVRTEAQLKDLSDYLSLPWTKRSGSALEDRSQAILSSLSRRDLVNIVSYALLDLDGTNVLDTSTSHIGDRESGRDYFVPTR